MKFFDLKIIRLLLRKDLGSFFKVNYTDKRYKENETTHTFPGVLILTLISFFILAPIFSTSSNAQIITTIAGNGTAGYSGDGGQATAAELHTPAAEVYDAAGNMYISDAANNRIRKINTSGVISTFAGNGTAGYSGDGGQATAAELNTPHQVVLDASGNYYIVDFGNNRIRKINSSGVISTIAGNGTVGFSGDGGQATAAEFNGPNSIAFDASGNIYVADYDNMRIRKITATTGVITTIAGNGTGSYSGDGGQATAAELYRPYDVTLDASGNVYIADGDNSRIRKITISSGVITTFAGNGTAGYSGNGGQATAAEINIPTAVKFDAAGNLYISEYGNNRIRKVTTSSGIITTFAGNGTAGFSGDGGQATAAEINFPYKLAFDALGNIYLADLSNNRIRTVYLSLIIQAAVTANVSCHGGSNGSAAASLAHGTSPYTYSWSGGPGSTNSTYTGLSAGTYTISVTDHNGIAGSATVSITQPSAALGVSATTTANVSCNGGNNGSASSTPSGGTSPYTYSWSGMTANTSTISGLTAGIYSVTVTDSHGCTATASTTVTQPTTAVLTVSATTTANVSCHGGANGSISSTPSGGISPYTYFWSGSTVTNSSITGLTAGTYTVIVTDSHACTATASATITQPSSALSVSTSVTANVSCYGRSDGSVSSTPSGGISPYTYSWSGGGTNSTKTGLTAGTYTITVTDSHSCTATASATITQPSSALSVSASVTADVICNGASTGSVSSTPSGGTSPYTYSWSGGGTNSTHTGLMAGTYTITVTDSHGCTVTSTVVVTQPAMIYDSIASTTYLACNAGANVTIGVKGGNSPYTYLWSPSGITTATATGLSWGTYTLTITDVTGCSITTQHTVTHPVVWTDSTGVSMSGDTLIKYTSAGWGNGGTASQNVLLAGQNGFVKVNVSGISGKVAIGLTSLNVSADYRTFDFAILIQHHNIYIYERGVLKTIAGSTVSGDILKIQRSGSTIFYKKNNIVLYTSYPPTTFIAALPYTGSLEVVTSLYDLHSHISGVGCTFSQNMFVAGKVIPQVGPDSLGLTIVTASSCHSPYQYIWNGIRYPLRNQFRPFLDSIIRADTLVLDTTSIFHKLDSLRQNNQNNNEVSGIYTGTVIDSIYDTVSINSNVGNVISWINNSGLSFSNIKSPRIVQYLPHDSLSRLIEGQPNLSEPVTCYSDSGNFINKTASNGWTSGEATSINNVYYNQYGKVSFVIPDITSVEAAGLKIDSVADIPGYGDILYGFYFQRGRVYAISNGSFTYIGKYRAGDLFSMENTYDSVALLQRVLYKQEGQLLKIVYINRASTGGTSFNGSHLTYAFKASIHTGGATISGLHIIGTGWWFGPVVTPNVAPASCGFPNTGAISLSIYLPPGWTITGYSWSQGYVWSPGGATTASISNLTPDQYWVKITFTYGSHPPVSYLYGGYDVGYKVYWANLGNAAMMGPGNTNSIYETGPPPTGGNSSNEVKYAYPTSGMSWIEFDAGNSIFPPFNNGMAAFGFTPNLASYSTLDITYGLYLYRFSPIIMAYGKGFSFMNFSSGITNRYMVSNDNPARAIRVYLNDHLVGYSPGVAPQNYNYFAKATLSHFGLGTSYIYHGICSFGCPDMNFPYATLTKKLDGSYYISPYGNLSFKYDEEYVNNGEGLPYTIYDMQHNIMYKNTLPPTAYKDNYYSIDLTAINSLIYHAWYILQVTNKKGEVTELRFQN